LDILNPARIDYVRASDTCIHFHSQNPLYYDWPVGFHVGLHLQDFWQLEEHMLGETTFTHYVDGTAHTPRGEEVDPEIT